MNAREGDLIETDGTIFDVKGLIHPPNRTIAFIRYFSDVKGDRTRNGTSYSKIYSLSRRYKMLEKRFPQYLVYEPVFDEVLCEVPNNEIKRRYEPIKRLQEMSTSKNLDELENKAVRLADALAKKASLPSDIIGVSGSILVRVHSRHSDIDLIVYGSENCRETHTALKDLLKSSDEGFKSYNPEDLKNLFDFRSKDSSGDFQHFVRTESRKVMQGKFLGTDYFVRFVKNWNEIDEKYGDTQYKNMGVAEIRATIADDREANFTPCVYKIGNTEVLDGPRVEHIEEIASFRGRFCEQARNGEVVLAQGKLEHVTQKRRGNEYFRLLLGNNPSDFMILA